MVDKPRRPILHLKFASAEPADPDAPESAEKPAAAPAARPLPIAPAARSSTKTVREFTPTRSPRPARPPRVDAPPPAPPKTFAWKCKPCGKGLDVPAELADEDYVRCPSCNARLGLARDFRSDPPNLDKVRARAVGKA
jgi:DNA-directed RNA polymerase subunit RPC12/RpoP